MSVYPMRIAKHDESRDLISSWSFIFVFLRQGKSFWSQTLGLKQFFFSLKSIWDYRCASLYSDGILVCFEIWFASITLVM
jgi:hypothetical protein